jgi:hypothetical protein
MDPRYNGSWNGINCQILNSHTFRAHRLTLGPNVSSIEPETTDIENRKKNDDAPSHAMVD